MKPSSILSRRLIEPHWLVRDMIPRGTMVILAGEAGAGKSTLMYCLAYAVATGLPFLGHQTFPTNVLYFDEENGEPDWLQYNQWAWAGLGCPPVEELDERLRLEHFALVAGWKEVMAKTIKEHQPGLVIVDTASPAFHIKDENDNAEATRIMQVLRHIRQLGDNTTFIVLKHEKHRGEEHTADGARTIRGAKAWLGAFDQVLYHVIANGAKRRKDGTRLTQLEPSKLRAFALKHRIRIDPSWTGSEPKGLILNAFPLYPRESSTSGGT
jgi:RecA-family ATPase